MKIFNLKPKVLLTLLLLVFISFAPAQSLKRKGMLGVVFYPEIPAPLSDSLAIKNTNAVLVKEVIPGTTAAFIGLQAYDQITQINNSTVNTNAELIQIASGLRTDDSIRVAVIRNKTVKILSGKVIERPRETIKDVDILYDEFPFQDGFIRCFLKTPKTKPSKGTIYFLPGIYCASLDKLPKDNPYYLLQEDFLNAGYQLFIVEKAGMGDSKSSIPCHEMGFNDEVQLFKEGYKKLFQYQNVQPKNVILFGHSLGGIIAPIIANEYNPKGIIIYGTVLMPWKDYILKAYSEQSLVFGKNKEKINEEMISLTPLASNLFEHPEKLNEITEDSSNVKLLEKIGYDSNSGKFAAGRTIRFHEEINQRNMSDVWSNINCSVLSLYGGADIAALSDAGHKRIVRIVNKSHSGKATYKFIPKTNHEMQKVGIMKKFIQMMETPEYNSYAAKRFNHEMMKTIINWCDAL